MDVQTLRRGILERFSDSAPKVRERIDPETGRLLSAEGGFAISSQGVLYPLALLYLTEGTSCHGDEKLLDDAVRVGDAMRDFQNPDGSWEFIKADGSTWGPTHMPWPLLPWLETWRLLGDKLGDDRRERWAEGIGLWCQGARDLIAPDRRIHNIPAYHAAILVRAANLLGLSEHEAAARSYMERIVGAQHPDGFWAEGGVPTTSYNGVYVHALGLYHAFTGDESVLPCLKRALDFHLHFTYPDGSEVETIDGRVRYHGNPKTMGLMGFLPFPEGRRLARLIVERILETSSGPSLDTGLGFVFEHFPDGETAEIPQTKSAFASIYNGRAAIRRAGPWFVCMNAYTAPVEDLIQRSRIRWHMDMQQLLSVWHEKTGLIVGGGNSKHQPEFCSFEVYVGGAHYVQPESATVRSDDHGEDVLELTYGPVRCTLTAAVDGDDLRLQYAAKSDDERARVRGGMTLWGIRGKEIKRGSDDPVRTLDPKASLGYSRPSDEKAVPLRIGSVEFDLPLGGNFHYPEYPFNPYAIEGVAGPESTVGAVWFDLPTDGTASEVRIRVAT